MSTTSFTIGPSLSFSPVNTESGRRRIRVRVPQQVPIDQLAGDDVCRESVASLIPVAIPLEVEGAASAERPGPEARQQIDHRYSQAISDARHCALRLVDLQFLRRGAPGAGELGELFIGQLHR